MWPVRTNIPASFYLVEKDGATTLFNRGLILDLFFKFVINFFGTLLNGADVSGYCT